MGKITLRKSHLLAVASTLALLPTVAQAQDNPVPAPAEQPSSVDQAATGGDTNDEIVITAQRRAERSRDVPISVTNISEEQLEVANVNQLSDTAKLTPGLRFDTQGPASQPTIRGVGTAITTSGGGPNVGTYVDGFFQANTYTSDLQLMNVRSIQVLKGPQGTLFGRNTTGGAILVTTADPSTEPSAEFKADYGRFNALKLQGYATFGITDKIAFDIEGLYRRGDGYFDDLTGARDHIGKYEAWSIRAGLKFEISDTVSLLLRYIHSENDDPTTQLVNAYVDRSGSAGFLDLVSPAGRAIYGLNSTQGLPLVYRTAVQLGLYASEPGDILLNPPLSFKTNTDTVQGTIKADLGFADLTSYTQYRRDKSPYFGDLDATALALFNINVDVDDKTFSQEFLLTSKPGSPLQWTAGVNYFRYKDTWDVNASFGTPFFDYGGSTTTTVSYAGFVDATYEVTDNLFLTAGARYSHDIVKDASFTTNPFTTFFTGPDGLPVFAPAGPDFPFFPNGTVIPVDTLKNNSITPRAVIRYKPNEFSSVYASYTRGYKAGILNVGGLSQQPVKPETINAFEVGYKYDRSGFAIDLAAFYYDYKNLQVSSFQSGAAQIRNAASSEIYGAEAQMRYRFNPDFNVYGGIAWTHARYKNFENAPFYSYCDPAVGPESPLFCVPIEFGGFGPGSIVQPLIDASGFKMQRSPEFTGNLGASYGIDVGGGRLTLSGNLYYTSSFYFDPSEQFKQKGYALLSARAEWTDPSERFSVAVWGDNITGKRYQTQVLFNTLGIGSVWSPPVTYGISLGAKF